MTHPLKIFNFCPKCGSKNFLISSPYSKKCADCNFEYFKNPIIGVAVLIYDESGKVLCLQRERAPGKGLLGLPGGFVDIGESIEEAAIREVLEETGAKVIKLKYLHREYYSVDWVYEGVTFPNKRVSYTYLCEIEKGDLKAQGLDGEFDNNMTLKWCTSKELEDLNLYKVDLELVKKIERENIEV